MKEVLLLLFFSVLKISLSFAASESVFCISSPNIDWLYIRLLIFAGGDCDNLQNIPDRNLIHDKRLEVDPCGDQIFKHCSSNQHSDGCVTTTKDPSTTPFQLIVQEYNFTAKMVKSNDYVTTVYTCD